MNTDEEKLNQLTERIIGLAFKVHNKLLGGFAEQVYQNSLKYELERAGLKVRDQVDIEIYYEDVMVGYYKADLIVEDAVLIEVKAVRNLDDAHTAQCLNYLAATKLPVCLLINFGRRVEVKRYRGPIT